MQQKYIFMQYRPCIVGQQGLMLVVDWQLPVTLR